MRITLFVLLLGAVFLVSCSQSADEIAAVVDETRAAEPSPTAVLVTVIHTAVVEVPVTVEVTSQVEVTRIVELPVTVTHTATPLNSPTPSDTPTATAVPTDTPLPTDTAIPTNMPPPTATPIINTATPTPSPTSELPGNPLPLIGGSYNGCPVLDPGVYFTAPYNCGDCQSMDLTNWALGSNQMQAAAAYEENGDIHIVFSSGEDINLHAVRIRWLVEINSLSRAIETWDDSITHIGVDQIQMYSILGPGTTIGYIPELSVMKVMVVCGE